MLRCWMLPGSLVMSGQADSPAEGEIQAQRRLNSAWWRACTTDYMYMVYAERAKPTASSNGGLARPMPKRISLSAQSRRHLACKHTRTHLLSTKLTAVMGKKDKKAEAVAAEPAAAEEPKVRPFRICGLRCVSCSSACRGCQRLACHASPWPPLAEARRSAFMQCLFAVVVMDAYASACSPASACRRRRRRRRHCLHRRCLPPLASPSPSVLLLHPAQSKKKDKKKAKKEAAAAEAEPAAAPTPATDEDSKAARKKEKKEKKKKGKKEEEAAAPVVEAEVRAAGGMGGHWGVFSPAWRAACRLEGGLAARLPCSLCTCSLG